MVNGFLSDPVPDGLGRAGELARQLGRRAAGAYKLDHPALEIPPRTAGGFGERQTPLISKDPVSATTGQLRVHWRADPLPPAELAHGLLERGAAGSAEVRLRMVLAEPLLCSGRPYQAGEVAQPLREACGSEDAPWRNALAAAIDAAVHAAHARWADAEIGYEAELTELKKHSSQREKWKRSAGRCADDVGGLQRKDAAERQHPERFGNASRRCSRSPSNPKSTLHFRAIGEQPGYGRSTWKSEMRFPPLDQAHAQRVCTLPTKRTHSVTEGKAKSCIAGTVCRSGL